jgi:hypothetical protein
MWRIIPARDGQAMATDLSKYKAAQPPVPKAKQVDKEKSTWNPGLIRQVNQEEGSSMSKPRHVVLTVKIFE